jgi:hypothetical protein
VSEQMLAELLDRVVPVSDRGRPDWAEVMAIAGTAGVQRRRWKPPRRYVALVAALALAVLLATPAFGVRDRILDLIDGAPAPAEVKTHFASSDALRTQLFESANEAGATLHDRFSPVVASRARGIFALDTEEGPIYLWAAPTEDGRQCWLVQSGADQTTGRPYGHGGCDRETHASGMQPQSWWTAERPSVTIVHARIYDNSITQVVAKLETGGTVAFPVAAGHALGTIEKDARLSALVGRNDEGEEIKRITFR